MNMHTTFTFTIELTGREFDLVTKGLCRILVEGDRRTPRTHKHGETQNDVEEARALAEKLYDGRIRESQSQVGRAETKKLSAQEVEQKLYGDADE